MHTKNKILIYDPNKQTRDHLKKMLSDNWNLILVDELEQAKYCLQNTQNCRLLCIQTKQASLFPITEVNKIQESQPHLKILWIYAHEDKNTTAAQQHVDKHIHKPFEKKELQHVINELLQS